MASVFRYARLFRPSRSVQSTCRSYMGQTTPRAGSRLVAPLLLSGAAIAGTAYGLHKVGGLQSLAVLPAVAAKTLPEYQPSVVSGTKDNALYLWIHLKPKADKKKCAQVVANLQSHVDAVCPPELRDESDEIFSGVGFGPNLYSQVTGQKTTKNYTYPHRKGEFGELPSTGGDIFIHAKSNSRSKLFELTQRLVAQLPPDSIESFEDVYGWVYQNGRDLSGFIDGTENAADEDSRQSIAVEKSTSGSYVITQKWIHDLDYIAKAPAKTLEAAVGRAKSDSTELSRKPIQSHVARMTGGNNLNQKKVHEIVRQSQPYGSVSGDSGLFFIAYAASPENFEFMLDRMVGAGGDGHSDLVMTFTKCVKGTYWYFPSVAELKKML